MQDVEKALLDANFTRTVKVWGRPAHLVSLAVQGHRWGLHVGTKSTSSPLLFLFCASSVPVVLLLQVTHRTLVTAKDGRLDLTCTVKQAITWEANASGSLRSCRTGGALCHAAFDHLRARKQVRRDDRH